MTTSKRSLSHDIQKLINEEYVSLFLAA